MIVLASDWVGLQIVEYLAKRDEFVEILGLHSSDRGGFNELIRAALPHANVRMEDALDATAVYIAESKPPPIGVLAWWPAIIKPPLLNATRWVNIHPSFLPYNRGKNPNFWCIVDGTPCGVTLHWADSGVDTGPIIAQRSLEVGWEQTGGTVYERCREVAVRLFTEQWDAIMAGRDEGGMPQAPGGPAHRSGDMEKASFIDLDAPTTARAVLNTIRARTFPPHPTATFTDNGATYGVTVDIRRVE